MNRKIARSLVTLSLMAPLLFGCSFSRHRINDTAIGEKVRAAQADGSLQFGTTTPEDVIRIVGSDPHTVLALPGGGRLLGFTYGQTKFQGFTSIILNITKSNTGLDTALFFFDENGRLFKHYGSTHSKDLRFEWWAFGD